jgi:hypothetical protein
MQTRAGAAATRCHAVAPDLFPLDDQGYEDIDEIDLASDHLAEARAGGKG